MKRVLSLLLAGVMLASLLLFSSCGNDTGDAASWTAHYTETDTVTNLVKLTVKDFGSVLIELDPASAPITVANFQMLVGSGFYDGLTFHRIMSGFMIQGGDPEGTGSGGSSEMIKGEFSQNGVPNPISHKRGVISMARASYSMDSASSQFFIVHQDSTFLDGQYAAFGRVLEGMNVVDDIAATPVTYPYPGAQEKSKPITPVILKSACFVTPNN